MQDSFPLIRRRKENSHPVKKASLQGRGCENSIVCVQMRHTPLCDGANVALQRPGGRLCYFSSYLKRFRGEARNGGAKVILIPLEDVPRVHFIGYIVQRRVIAVGDDGVGLGFKRSQVVDNPRAEEGDAVL